MRTILKIVLIGLFVLTINKPLFVFALGEIDGIWVGEETVSVLDEQVSEITGTIIFQESDSTLYIYDDLFGELLLVKSGDQWVLPSPLETTYFDYTCIINKISLIFHGESYLTGTITVTVYAYGEEYVGHASLSHDKQLCQTLSNGATVSNLSGGEDSLKFFEVDFPPGAINLNIQTWGGSGDCDLYLIYSRPDFYNDWSDDDFNDEEITVASPSTGKWYIVIEGWESYSGVNLRVTYDSYEPYGELVSSDLWIGAIINSEEKGPIEAVWQKGGEDTTSRGDTVIWGHFYASPSDVTWGCEDNPDLFVKIWFDVSGRVDVNYFHVSVPDIEVYSDYPYDGIADEHGTTTMSRRYIRQYYEGGQSYSEDNYEDGNPPSGYSPSGNPSGYSIINDFRIGSIINTVEKGPIDAVWRFGGQDTTSRGDQVVWGHFYVDPSDVTWGSRDNPDLFVKVWFDVSGRVDVNYFHVSVPDIEVYSDLPDDGTYDQKGKTIMDNRYIRHEYWDNFLSAVIIADHQAAANFSNIPSGYFSLARSTFNIYYGHTSHGSQIVTGMSMLENEDANYGLPPIHETGPDLGYPTWEPKTREYLDEHPETNLVMWSWCGQLSGYSAGKVNDYLTNMNRLEADYPNVTFIYMTGHLNGSGPSGTLYANNNQIRSFCRENSKTLFDFADIESYDPNGNYYPDGGDACEWCSTWCDSHVCPSCDHCAHSHCFNCYLKGKAFWWLLARLSE